jgi:acyl-CoA hydrolase
MKAKRPSESLTVMTEIVLPNDTNNLNNLFGGQLLSWMDRCAAIAAHRHSRRIAVTASVNNVSFKQAIPVGSIVTLEAKVSRAFSSSMEVFVEVSMEDQRGQGNAIRCNEAMYTFVAVDQNGKPIEVPEVVPETAEEIEFFEGALRRRQLRLVLAQRMKPEDAVELRAIFNLDKK